MKARHRGAIGGEDKRGPYLELLLATDGEVAAD